MKRIKIHTSILFSFALMLLLGMMQLSVQGQAANGEVTLTWTAYDPGDSSLQVWYFTELQLPDSSFVAKTTQATSVTYTGLTVGSDYPWLLDAYGCTASEASGITSGTKPQCANFSARGSGATTASAPAPPPTDIPPTPTQVPGNVGTDSPVSESCALAYSGPGGGGSISVSWSPHAPDVPEAVIWYCVNTADEVKFTSQTSATFTGLIVGDEYGWHVDAYSCVGDESMEDGTCPRITQDDPHAAGSAIATGGRAKISDGSGGSDDDGDAPIAPTLSYVDHSVTVSGQARYQALTFDGIGDADIIALGVISATNVWGTVPPGTRVCFVGRAGGGVMFKDSSTTPHPVYWLGHYLNGNNTCVDLPGAGTVVLVGQSSPYADAAPAPAADALPQQAICQIKLVETLFLRAQPEGQIIGLVWRNSEVPVFAIDGHWYRVEFEGQVGYISRYHRQVLAGNC